MQTCAHCGKGFEIDSEESAFYKRIEVPLPTQCPECQMRHLMMWRNERSLYKRKDESGKDIISIFSSDKPFTVYERERWWSDDWDPLAYGKEYDFSKPFFTQFRELLERVPLESVFNKNAVNSAYCNHSEDMKNCYLSFASIWNEGVSYSSGAINCKDSFDTYFCDKSELMYESISSEACYRVFFSAYVSSCTDSAFLVDCRGCSNCFGCVNLRNKSYHIFNKPYTKEDYFKKLGEFDLGSRRGFEKMSKQFAEFVKAYPYRYAHITNCTNSTGEMLWNCKNCKWCFNVVENTENCKYVTNGGYDLKDSYRAYGIGKGELMYNVVDTGLGTSKVFFAVVFRNGINAWYAYDCYSSSNLFGCVGLRSKQYCILNKQYSKEECEALLPRIKKHMDEMPYVDAKGKKYGFGEFFPHELSPFAYNETIAQEYYPLTKEEALKQGYKWKDPEARNYAITKLPGDLPDHIKEVDDSILKETIQCEHNEVCNEQCTKAFKIIADELQFYRRMNLSLPRLCPNCRHYARLRQRNPMYLWHRNCMCKGGHFHGENPCPNKFETSYAPDRPEIIYCEQCYNAEVA